MLPNSKKPEPTEKNRLINLSLNYLKIHPRSANQLQTYLQRKSNHPETIISVVDYLQSLNLVSDSDYCQWVVRTHLTKLKGPAFIRQNLKSAGISASLIDSTFSSLDFDAFFKAALTYLQKHALKIARLPSWQQPLKAKQLLYARGFDARTISAAIDEFTTSH